MNDFVKLTCSSMSLKIEKKRPRHLSPLLSHKVTPYLKRRPLCAITNCIIALLAGNSIKPMASLQLSISIISVHWMVMSWSEYSAEMKFWRERDKARRPKLRTWYCSASEEREMALCIRRGKKIHSRVCSCFPKLHFNVLISKQLREIWSQQKVSPVCKALTEACRCGNCKLSAWWEMFRKIIHLWRKQGWTGFERWCILFLTYFVIHDMQWIIF